MTEKLVVSLSTIPPRFHMLGRTLRTILDQSIRIDEIHVNIPTQYRRFPDHVFSKPDVPEGVTIRVCDVDYGPATKVLPALKEYRGTDTRIIFCDDDRLCNRDWAKTLVEKSRQRPKDAITNCGWHLDKLGFSAISHNREPIAVPLRSRTDLVYRVRRIRQQISQIFSDDVLPKPPRSRNFQSEGYIDILEGCGGVLVKSGFFDERVFEVPEKVWTVDDIWLSGMLDANGVGIWSNNKGIVPSEQIGAADDALCNDVIEGLNRRQANIACVEFLRANYDVWTHLAPKTADAALRS